ncbi:MAG: TonB-dependent receptor [Gammaproteobacteria bacterium]|nr:MAG: TonB-dependent receptor [Gammaproteobacteria bacterium]
MITLRFALNYENYDFSTNNLHPGAPDGGLKQINLRLISVTELDNLTITTKLHNENWSGKPKPIASLGINKVDGSGLCSPSQAGSSACSDNFGGQVGGDDFWDVRADTADREHETDSWGASVKLAWQLNPNITLNSLTAFNDLTRFHSWDSDGAMNLIEGSMGTDNSVFSQELNIVVQNDNSYWISGLFFINEKIDQKNEIDLFRDFRGIAPGAVQFFYDNQLQNTSIALYSQFDYQLSQSLTLTTGLRYTDETTKYRAMADLDTEAAVIPAFWDVSDEITDDELSWKLALTHKISKSNSVYYSYSRGYKSGGYNAGYTTSPAQALDSEYAPEKLNAYEVGSKLLFWQSDASLNLAAFYYDYQDQQVFVNKTTGIAPYHVLKNAGDSTIYGLEAEFFVTPTDNIQVNLNVGYLPEANIGTFVDEELIVADNRLPFSSKWNISGFFLYENELFGHTLTSQLGFDYQSDFYFDQNENPYTEQTDFIVWNGRISYQFNEQLTLMLWGKNLTNTEYSELRFDSIAALGAITELKAQARQLGIELAYNF